MTDPATLEEFNARTLTSTRIEGYGLDVTTYLPCPGCAAPDWLAMPITTAMRAYRDITGPRTCAECGRACRISMLQSRSGISFEFVQVSGDPLPAYLPPMRHD